MRQIYCSLLIIFILSNCKTEVKTNIEEKKSIKQIENQIIESVNEFENSIINSSDNNSQKFKDYLSPNYIKYFCEQTNIKEKNIDETLDKIYLLTASIYNDFRKKDVQITSEVIGIKERIIEGDTLIFLIQNDIILTSQKKKKKLVSTDFILAISTNYGDKWFLYQPNINDFVSLLKNEVGANLAEKTIQKTLKYKPKEVISSLN